MTETCKTIVKYSLYGFSLSLLLGLGKRSTLLIRRYYLQTTMFGAGVGCGIEIANHDHLAFEKKHHLEETEIEYKEKMTDSTWNVACI